MNPRYSKSTLPIVLLLAFFLPGAASAADNKIPSVPTGLTASAAGCSQINLSWTASTDTGGSGLAGYKVYRNGVQIASTNVTSYSSTGLAASTSYSFSVAAYDNSGNTSGQSTSRSATTPSCPDTTAPSIPTGLTASAAGCSQINLSWTASTDTGGSGLAGYKVYRNGVQIASTNATSYSSTGLAASTTYFYKVAAYDNSGNTSAQSAYAGAKTPSCVVDTTAPSIPTGLTASAASCSQINLSWTASSDTGGSGLAGYRVYRNGVHIATTSATSYSSTGLAGSTGYSFTVDAYDNAGNASAQSTSRSATTPSCADTTAPSIPTGLTASAASCSQVNLSWAGSSDTGGSGLAGYRVYRNGVQIATTSVASYSSTGLAGSTSYSFTVAAYDNAGNTSGQSASVSRTTPSCADTTAPSIPTGLTAAAASCSQVNLSWTGSSDTGGSGLAGYRVYRNGVQIATTSVASYSSTGLAASTSYSFSVAAYDNAGNTSGQSASVSRTTPSCADTTAPSIPTGLTAAAASCSQVNLSWTGSSDTGGSGFAGYRVYRNGVQIATTSATSYSSTGLAGSTSYSFTVAAYDNAGNTSGQSASVSRTTPSCADTTAPSIPTGLTGAAAGCSQVNLSWAGSSDTGGSGLAGYRVYRNAVQIGTTSATSYSSTGLAASTGYSFSVAAYDNAGNTSAQSTAASATTPACDQTLGAFAWNKHFGGPNLADGAIPHGVAVDTGGSALVVGEFTYSVNFGGGPLTSAGDSDVFLVKYSATGAYLWSKRFGGTGSDKGYGVAVDSAGNVVIVGYFSGVGNFGGAPLTTAGNTDIFVAKYSPAGDHLWSRGFGSTGIDYAMGVVVDRNSDVVVTGYFGLVGGPIDFGGGPLTSAGDSDVFVAKFSAAGAHVWSKRAGGPDTDRSLAIAVDAGGNVAITGWFSQSASFGGSLLTSAGYGDLFVAEYSATGAHLWSKRFGGVGSDVGNSIAIDSGGNVIVAGSFNGTIDFGGGPLVSNASNGNMFLVKFSSTGNHVWSERFGNGLNAALGVTTDAAGNVLLSGSIGMPTDFGGGILWGNTWDIFLAKFTSAGAYIWAKRFGAGYEDQGYAVASDASGNVILTGAYYDSVDFGGGAMSSPGGNDAFLVRFGP